MKEKTAAIGILLIILVSGCINQTPSTTITTTTTTTSTTSTVTIYPTTTTTDFAIGTTIPTSSTITTTSITTSTTTTPITTTTTIQHATTTTSTTVTTTTTTTTTTTLGYSNNLTISYIDVGQGDSILIQTPNGSAMLIDAGDNNYGDDVISYLQSQGVNKLNYLVTTHPHADHIGGADYVLQHIAVDHVLDNGQNSTSQTYTGYITLAKQKDYKVVSKGSMIDLDPSLDVKVISPPGGLLTNDSTKFNENSVVIRILMNNVKLLFGGDCETLCENNLLNSGYNIDIDIYKVHHHGSDTSSTQVFLDVITPKISVISVGAGNLYGHPKQTTIDKLRNVGSQIYRTDLNGSIKITTDGTSYSVI